MNKFCTIEVTFTKSRLDKAYQLGEAICGTILIIPKLDFEIVQIGCELQGVFTPPKYPFKRQDSIDKRILLEKATLKKGEPMSFDFSVKNETVEAYKAFSSELRVFIQMKEGSKFNSKNWIETSIPVEVSGKGLGYEVNSPAVNLEMEEPLVILGAILFFILFIYLQPGHPIILYMLGFVGLLILTLIGHNIYRARFIGTVQARFKTIDDENFEVILFSNLNWKYASTMFVKYTVHEVMSGELGSDGQRKRTIHKSKEIKINKASNSRSISFAFPKGLPGSTNISQRGIYYFIVCRVKSKIGFGHTHKGYFKVRRQFRNT